MHRLPLYRNVRAREHLDIFLISGITSLLTVRFYLEVTGYPQLGNGPFHIAHMLWGGLLMAVAITINLSFLGIKARQLSALLGGIGFGVFIDELGKFITEDNNYFFQPTIGLIYAIFVILYLVFNFLTKDQPLSSREYQLNAIAQLEEAIAFDMDAGEKRQVIELLAKADPHSNITKELKRLVETIEISGDEKPGFVHRLSVKADKIYSHYWKQKNSNLLIRALFIFQIIGLFTTILATTYMNISDIKLFFDDEFSYGEELIIGQFLSATVAAGFVFYGLIRLPESRVYAFEQFRRATLINIYLTQFFLFSRIQFGALPGLIFNIVLLIIIGFVSREERRLQQQ